MPELPHGSLGINLSRLQNLLLNPGRGQGVTFSITAIAIPFASKVVKTDRVAFPKIQPTCFSCLKNAHSPTSHRQLNTQGIKDI